MDWLAAEGRPGRRPGRSADAARHGRHPAAHDRAHVRRRLRRPARRRAAGARAARLPGDGVHRHRRDGRAADVPLVREPAAARPRVGRRDGARSPGDPAVRGAHGVAPEPARDRRRHGRRRDPRLPARAGAAPRAPGVGLRLPCRPVRRPRATAGRGRGIRRGSQLRAWGQPPGHGPLRPPPATDRPPRPPHRLQGEGARRP